MNEGANQKIQSVVLTLSDGMVVSFVGPAVILPGEKRKVRKIAFTLPEDLPEGAKWSALAEKHKIEEEAKKGLLE